MLDIKKVQSKNECNIAGILNELEIVEGTTSDGRDYIRGTATVRVDTQINGKVVESLIPVSMFSMRKKSDGSDNKIFDTIKGYKESLTSLSAADVPAQASRVIINGRSANLTENMWADARTNKIRSTFQISSNFINVARDNEKEEASFEVVGVILNTREEVDSDGDSTGRLIVSVGLVGYNGKMDVVEMYAADNAKAHIESNWNKGDTVTIIGVIKMTQKVTTYTEEVGFGEPIERHRTERCRELIITAGSTSGADEDHSYDADDVKAALAERKARQDKLLEKA